MKKTLFSLLACVVLLCGCASESETPSSKEKDVIPDAETSQGEKGSAVHEHTFSSKWCSDDTYHWHEATCGHEAVKDKSSHTFGKWEVDVQPTETSQGEKHRYCSVCYYKESETMDKVEHVHSWGEATYVWGLGYSTCTASHSCTKNLYHKEEETVNSSYEVLYEPTTSSVGRECYTAEFENADFATQTKYVTIPKLDVPVTGISLSKTSIEVSKGSYTYLFATLTPSDASNTNVIWSSSEESVATVKDGLVTGVNEGKATITATSEEGGYSAKCEVTVTYIPVTGVSLSNESTLLEIGEESSTIYANVAPSGASISLVTWSIGDESVASFETTWLSGVKVKGLSVGETTLTAITKDGGFAASCKIKVIEKKNLSYEVGEASLRVYQYNSSNYISAYIPVTNNGNISIYVSGTGFDIEDGEGSLKQSIGSFSVKCRPSIIRPGETTYVCADTKYTGDTTEGLVCLPHLTVKDASSADDIRYEVSGEVSFTPNAYSAGFKASGTVVNSTEKTSSIIYVAVLAFDKNGDYYTTLTGSVYDDLEPGASASFTASNSDLYYHGNEFVPDDIGNYMAFAYEFELFY